MNAADGIAFTMISIPPAAELKVRRGRGSSQTRLRSDRARKIRSDSDHSLCSEDGAHTVDPAALRSDPVVLPVAVAAFVGATEFVGLSP